jgi:hypothetical protein
MPYAVDDQVATDEIEGGIEITDEQYVAAVEAVGLGKLIRVEEGELVFKDPPPPEEPELPEPDPDAPKVVPKLVVIERMTPEEAETADAAMAMQPAKLRQIWNAVNEIWSNSPWFSTLQEFFISLFGQTRADQILSFE